MLPHYLQAPHIHMYLLRAPILNVYVPVVFIQILT
uniref:Uncharacterized protein n=1 Tax=Arundo donax TaxID=35708 RepID=A0A0A9FFG3_ARUDO